MNWCIMVESNIMKSFISSITLLSKNMESVYSLFFSKLMIMCIHLT